MPFAPRSLRCFAPLALVATLAAAGCGGAPPPDPRFVETGGLELSLRRHDGVPIELSAQRGAPVLLFLFATYDGVSIATTRGVARFARDALDTVVIGVLLQHDARRFAETYVTTEAPPFTVAYDPEEIILEGRSALGAFDAVPTLIMLDARGHEVGRHVGYVSERQLAHWLEEARARGGIVAPAASPGGEESAPFRRSGDGRAARSTADRDEFAPGGDEEAPAGEAPELAPGDLVIEPD